MPPQRIEFSGTCFEVEHSISTKCTTAEKDLLRLMAAQKLK